MLNYTLKLFSRIWTYYRHLREIRVPTIPAWLIIKMKSFTSGPSPWLTLKCDNILGESCDCKAVDYAVAKLKTHLGAQLDVAAK